MSAVKIENSELLEEIDEEELMSPPQLSIAALDEDQYFHGENLKPLNEETKTPVFHRNIARHKFDPDSNVIPIAEFEGKPFCQGCKMYFFTWQGFEFHVLNDHIDYRPFRCSLCPSFSFHTEAEGRHHINLHHPTQRNMGLYKCIEFDKEMELQQILLSVSLIQQQTNYSYEYHVASVMQNAGLHMQKFHRMRFAVPISLKKPREDTTSDADSEAKESEDKDENSQNQPTDYVVFRQNFHNQVFDYNNVKETDYTQDHDKKVEREADPVEIE